MRRWLLNLIRGVDRRYYEDALDIIEDQNAEMDVLKHHIQNLKDEIEYLKPRARAEIERERSHQAYLEAGL